MGAFQELRASAGSGFESPTPLTLKPLKASAASSEGQLPYHLTQPLQDSTKYVFHGLGRRV